MKRKIKVIPVETGTDTQMSLQISQVKTYSKNNVIKSEWCLNIVLIQDVGLKDDGCLSTIMSPRQIEKLIGQLVCAKAEIENKNKCLNNK